MDYYNKHSIMDTKMPSMYIHIIDTWKWDKE